LKYLIKIIFLLSFCLSQEFNFNTNDFKVNNSQDFGKSFVGLEAPGFYLKDIGGNDFFLSKNLEKPILINFFNTQCSPCMAEIPLLIDFFNKYEAKINFVVIDVAEYALSTTKKRETSEDIINAFKRVFKIDAEKLSFPILIDQYSVASINYNIVDVERIYPLEIPVSFFIDTNGIIFWEHKGRIREADLIKLTKSYEQIFN